MWRYTNLFACLLVLCKDASSQSKVRKDTRHFIFHTHRSLHYIWCSAVNADPSRSCYNSTLTSTPNHASHLFHVRSHGATASDKWMTWSLPIILPKPSCLKPADGSGYVSFFMMGGNPPNEGFCVTGVAVGFCNDSSSVQARCQQSVGELALSGVTVISGCPCLHSCWTPVTPHSPST